MQATKTDEPSSPARTRFIAIPITAGYELLKKSDNYEVIILEQSDVLGGISKTVRHNGHRMDIGGHRFFSKDKSVNDFWAELMPVQGAPSFDDKLLCREKPLSSGGPDPEKEDRVMLMRRRISRIYYLRKFFDYPISMKPQTFINMGLQKTVKAGFSYLKSTVSKKDVGRCDLYGGDREQLIESLERLGELDPKLKLYAGHGPDSTLGEALSLTFFF